MVVWLRDWPKDLRVAGSIPETTDFLTNSCGQATSARVSLFSKQCKLVPASLRADGETLSAFTVCHAVSLRRASSSSSSFILKHPSLPRSARVRRSSRSEASPHIPEHCPFRMQTKHLHIILHTFIPSLPFPPLTSRPATSTFLQADSQSSTLLRSRCPNHLNLPHLTTSATLCTNPHCISYPSATPRTSISPSSVPSSPDNADLLSSSPRFQSHMSMHSGHKPCISFPLCGMMHPGLSEWEITPWILPKHIFFWLLLPPPHLISWPNPEIFCLEKKLLEEQHHPSLQPLHAQGHW